MPVSAYKFFIILLKSNYMMMKRLIVNTLDTWMNGFLKKRGIAPELPESCIACRLWNYDNNCKDNKSINISGAWRHEMSAFKCILKILMSVYDWPTFSSLTSIFIIAHTLDLITFQIWVSLLVIHNILMTKIWFVIDQHNANK